MLTALLLALGFARVLPFPGTVIVAVIWAEPLVAAPALGLAIIGSRRQRLRLTHSLQVAAFMRSVASELRAGRSLRSAVTECMRIEPALGMGPAARLAEIGRPLEEVAEAMAAFRGMVPVAAAIRVLARTGGPAVTVFEGLASDASEKPRSTASDGS